MNCVFAKKNVSQLYFIKHLLKSTPIFSGINSGLQIFFPGTAHFLCA